MTSSDLPEQIARKLAEILRAMSKPSPLERKAAKSILALVIAEVEKERRPLPSDTTDLPYQYAVEVNSFIDSLKAKLGGTNG